MPTHGRPAGAHHTYQPTAGTVASGADSRYRASKPWPPPSTKPHAATGSPVPLGPFVGGWLHVGHPKGHPEAASPHTLLQVSASSCCAPLPTQMASGDPPASPRQKIPLKIATALLMGRLGLAETFSTGGYQAHIHSMTRGTKAGRAHTKTL